MDGGRDKSRERGPRRPKNLDICYRCHKQEKFCHAKKFQIEQKIVHFTAGINMQQQNMEAHHSSTKGGRRKACNVK